MVSGEEFGETAAASPALVVDDDVGATATCRLCDSDTEDSESPSRPPDEFTSDETLEKYSVATWQSVDHRMTHFPMLADCPICQRANNNASSIGQGQGRVTSRPRSLVTL